MTPEQVAMVKDATMAHISAKALSAKTDFMKSKAYELLHTQMSEFIPKLSNLGPATMALISNAHNLIEALTLGTIIIPDTSTMTAASKALFDRTKQTADLIRQGFATIFSFASVEKIVTGTVAAPLILAGLDPADVDKANASMASLAANISGLSAVIPAANGLAANPAVSAIGQRAAVAKTTPQPPNTRVSPFLTIGKATPSSTPSPKGPSGLGAGAGK